jgi:hypothetical protein
MEGRSSDNHANVICGPIVGLVTCNSANILLEFDKDISNLECSLIDQSTKGLEFKISNNNNLTFTAYEPKVLKFELPEKNDNNNYMFVIRDMRVKNNSMHNACFHTFGKNCKKFDVVTVSCNQVSQVNNWDNPSENLWINIDAKMKNNYEMVDLVLHLGGQVDLHGRLNKLLADSDFVTKANQLTSEQLTTALTMEFCEVIRSTFCKKYINNILSSAQNLMMWNSCESLEDYNMNKFNKAIKVNVNLLEIAKNVYRKYQRALWDTEFKDTDSQYSCHKWGKYGLFIFDIKRKSNDESTRSLSREQIVDIKKFSEDPKLQILMFGSNIPIISDLPEECLKQAKTDPTNLNRWPCREKAFKMIFRYLEKVQSELNKTPIILTGNCENTSFAGKSIIVNNLTGTSITQLCTGPIVGNASKNIGKYMLSYKNNWNIVHTSTNNNNYAALSISVRNGNNNISSNIVTSDDLNKSKNDKFNSMNFIFEATPLKILGINDDMYNIDKDIDYDTEIGSIELLDGDGRSNQKIINVGTDTDGDGPSPVYHFNTESSMDAGPNSHNTSASEPALIQDNDYKKLLNHLSKMIGSDLPENNTSNSASEDSPPAPKRQSGSTFSKPNFLFNTPASDSTTESSFSIGKFKDALNEIVNTALGEKNNNVSGSMVNTGNKQTNNPEFRRVKVHTN